MRIPRTNDFVLQAPRESNKEYVRFGQKVEEQSAELNTGRILSLMLKDL